MVFGDFDADGITGLAILTLALRRLGVEAMPYVPSRLEEGHGLSLAAVEAARRPAATRDRHGRHGVLERRRGRRRERAPGSTSSSPITTACRRCCRRRWRSSTRTAPTRTTRTAGSRAAASRSRSRGSCSARAALGLRADLAAIGTVADLAPVLGENRAIVQLGLERLRVGPAARASRRCSAGAGATAADVDLETLGFGIAPRLNAAGRVGEAFDAARLLLADDAGRGGAARRDARGRQPHAPRPDEDGHRRGADLAGRGRRRGGDPGPRSVAGGDRRASSPRASPTSAAGRPSSGRGARRLDPGLVSERGRAPPRRRADRLLGPPHPPRRPRRCRRLRDRRPSAGTTFTRALPRAGRRERRRPDARPTLAVDLALRAAYVDYGAAP